MNNFLHDSDSDDSSDDDYEMSGERCEDKDNSEGGSSGRYYNAMEECRISHASSSSSLSSRLFPATDDNENEAAATDKFESCRMEEDITFQSLIEPNDSLLHILQEQQTPTNTAVAGETRPRSSSSISSNGKSFLPKLRELTIIDAIMGFRHEQQSVVVTRGATASSPEEVIDVEAIRKAAYEDYIGVPVHVIVRRKTDAQQCVFKNNTRLMQTIKAHDGAIHSLKFSTDGKFLATGYPFTHPFIIISHIIQHLLLIHPFTSPFTPSKTQTSSLEGLMMPWCHLHIPLSSAHPTHPTPPPPPPPPFLGGADAQVLVWGLGYPPPGSNPNSRHRQMTVAVFAGIMCVYTKINDLALCSNQCR